MKKVYTLIAILALAYGANAQSTVNTSFTGAVSSAWNDAGNWTYGVPGSVASTSYAITIPANKTVTITAGNSSALTITLTQSTMAIYGTLILDANKNNTTLDMQYASGTPTGKALINVYSGGSISFITKNSTAKLVRTISTTPVTILQQTTASSAGVVTNSVISTTPTTSYSMSMTTASGGFDAGTATMLPAVLVSFDAVQQGGNVNLSWKTQQEQNTKAFIVEKSTNGVDYSAIGTVAAAGNATTPRSYSFVDAASSALSYYRVRIVDQDGRSALTSVKAIRGANVTAKVGVFPNPAVGVANVVVDNPAQEAFSMNVFNRTGQLVAQQRAAAGTNFVRLDVNRFAAGDYTIDVQFANGSRQHSKMIVAAH